MPTTSTAISTASRRRRRSRSRLRLRVLRARRWGAGGDIEGTVAHGSSAFNAREPSRGNDQSQSGGRSATTLRGSIGPVSTDGRTPRIEVPRWIQLVGLPILLVLAWVIATAAGHVVFLFLVAALVALLLDPIVRGLQRGRLPRGLSVALVYLTFFAAVVLVIVAVATAVVGQTKTAADRFNGYFTNRHGVAGQTSADRDVDRLQHWLNTHHLQSVHVREARPQARAPDPAAGRRQVHAQDRHVRRGRGDLDRQDAVLARAADRRVGLHAARHGAVRPRDRPALPAPTGRGHAAAQHGARARVLRPRAAAPLADHRRERGVRSLGARGARSPAARAAVRAALRRRGGDHRGHPVSRPVARCDSTARLRARRASDLGGVGGAALPRDPSDRGARRRAERDGQRAAAPSAARDLRARGRRRGVRPRGRADRPALARGRAARSGSSSPIASSSSRGRGRTSRWRSSWPRRVPCDRELLPDHAPAPPAQDGTAARPRAGDVPDGRRSRDAALRRAGRAAERAASGACASHRRVGRARMRRARRSRSQVGDPVRPARGEGRRGLRGLDRGRGRAAGTARAAAAVPGARAAHRCLPVRVHEPRPLRGDRLRRRGRQRRVARADRAHRRLARRGRRRRRLPERHDGRPCRGDSRAVCRRRRSSPTPRSTRRRSTARSATWRTRRPRSATAAATRWTRATCARRCASASRTSPRARTC